MNVVQYSQLTQLNWKANLGDMTSWKPKYTFYADFAIAEFFQTYGKDAKAIKSTYDQVIKSWSGNYEALTEIVMVLNHKSWAFAPDSKGNAGVDARYLGISKDKGVEIAQLYVELYEKAEELFFKKFGKDEKATSYYYEVTD